MLLNIGDMNPFVLGSLLSSGGGGAAKRFAQVKTINESTANAFSNVYVSGVTISLADRFGANTASIVDTGITEALDVLTFVTGGRFEVLYQLDTQPQALSGAEASQQLLLNGDTVTPLDGDSIGNFKDAQDSEGTPRIRSFVHTFADGDTLELGCTYFVNTTTLHRSFFLNVREL